MKLNLCMLAPSLFFASAPISAKLELAPVFTSSMVLQRDHPVVIRGRANPGAEVAVTIGNSHAVSEVSADGDWRAELPPRAAGGPFRIDVTTAGERIELNDVMFGDVWLCSGQSNMGFSVRRASNAETVIAQSDNSIIRLLMVPRQSSAKPQRRFSAPAYWQRTTSASVAPFSAACYFMGRDLQRSLQATGSEPVAVGLIAASVGGSIIQDWISAPALRPIGPYAAGLDLLDLHDRDPSAAEARWLEQLRTYFAATEAGAPPRHWIRADTNHVWESWGDPALASFDGTAIYRTSVKITADQARNARWINLGTVDDIDLTDVNGRVLGATMGWDVPRRYALAAGTLKAGINQIEIKVLDLAGDGGMFGDARRTIELADGSVVPLSGVWQFAIGKPLGQSGRPPYVPWYGSKGLTTLFNGMIAPIGTFPVRGIAWYQGESNTDDPAGYAKLLPALIADWRSRFDTGPFIVVQLPNFGAPTSVPTESSWASLREAQRQTVLHDPRAGMAVTIDIGDRYDLHPTNKAEAGRRMATAALTLLGAQDAPPRPVPVAASRSGNDIEVRLNHAVIGVGNGRPIGFELCDGASRCRFVDAELRGRDRIILPARTSDREVRYLWADSPIVNVYDARGLPLEPFKLDIAVP